MDGHFIQIFLRLIQKFLEIIDFQCAFGFAQITWRELFRLERHAAGREQQDERKEETDRLMFQEWKNLRKRWNDEKRCDCRHQNAERQDEARAEHDRMLGSEQGACCKNRGESG